MRALLCFLCLTLWLAAVRAETITPIDTVESFYSWVLVRPPTGMPSPKERVQLAKWLAPELLKMLDAARVTQDRCIRVAPEGDKPELLEGNLFSGNEDGATEAAYREAKQAGGKASVAVDLVGIDKRLRKGDRRRAVAWQAEVTLVAIDRRWYVEDIRFDRDRSLRSTLQEYNDEGARTCVTRKP